MDNVLGKVGDSFAVVIPQSVKKLWNHPPAVLKVAGIGLLGFVAINGILESGNRGPFNDIVWVPIVEEIFFRGVLTAVAANIISHFGSRNPKPAELQTQKTIAILTSAAIYASTNENRQGWCFWFLARSLGYMHEATGSLLPSMVCHGIHNAICSISDPLEMYDAWIVPGTALSCLVLARLGKNINPISAVRDTYRCLTRPATGNSPHKTEGVKKSTQIKTVSQVDKLLHRTVQWTVVGLGLSVITACVIESLPEITFLGAGTLGAFALAYKAYKKRSDLISKKMQVIAQQQKAKERTALKQQEIAALKAVAQSDLTIKIAEAVKEVKISLSDLSEEEFGKYLFYKMNVSGEAYRLSSDLDIAQLKQWFSLFLALKALKISPLSYYKIQGEPPKDIVEVVGKSPLTANQLKVRNLWLPILLQDGHIVRRHDRKLVIDEASSAHYQDCWQTQKKAVESTQWYLKVEENLTYLANG